MSRGGPAIASKQLEATEEADSSSQPPEGAYPADILSLRSHSEKGVVDSEDDKIWS